MGEKLDARTKWSYCIGATGRDAAYALISMFLILYVQYTIDLTPAQFSVITAGMVLCMIWDAINDPMMGIIIENAHLSFGKYKPWILMGAVLNAVVIIGIFTIRPTGWAFVAFFILNYLLWGMTYTINDISYWGMLPSLTSDAAQRNLLVTIMSVFMCIGQFAVAGIVPVVIAGNAVRAYRTVALIVALCFIAFQTLTTFGVRERPRVDTEKVSLKKMFQIFFRNDQLVTSGFSYLLFTVGQNLIMMFGVNFFYVEFGYSRSGDLVFFFTLMYGLGTLISQALYAFLSSRFKRMQLLTISMGAIVLSYLLLLSVGYLLPKNVILINVIGFLIFFFQGIYAMVMLIMLNNTIEYDEVRTGERHDSIVSSMRSFAVKFASGIDQGLYTLILMLSGVYAMSNKISSLEAEAGAGEITKAVVLEKADAILGGIGLSQSLGLRLGMVVIPIAAIGFSYRKLRKGYTIDEAEYDRLVGVLEERKTS